MNDRLYRSRDDRMLAGVAGGLAEMWDADPSLVRLVWALLTIFTGGIALVVYIVLAIVVPEADAVGPVASAGGPEFLAGSDWRTQRAAERARGREARRATRLAGRGERGRSGGLIIGAILVLLGVWFLVREYLPTFDTDWFWPLALVLLGVTVLAMAIRPRRDDRPMTSTGSAPGRTHGSDPGDTSIGAGSAGAS
jgi:phage shock protein C